MSHLRFRPTRLPKRRRNWSIGVLIGAFGAVIAAWFQEIISHVQEVMGLVLLPAMAAVIYALDLLMFRSRRLTGPDSPKAPQHGGGK